MAHSYSPLRYPGGKTKLYNEVLKILEANNLIGETYIEPFAGGAGLALKLLLNNKVKRIVLNDFDPAIYSFWFCVLNHTKYLCERIMTCNVDVDEWKKQKYIYDNPSNNTVQEYGFATFFLNRTNVSGIIKGGIIGGESQEGKYKIDARFNKLELIKKIQSIANQKNRIYLYNMDAKDFLNTKILRCYYKVLINCDPPYVNKGAQLYKNSFTTADHKDLYEKILNCKRKWIVTYDICDLITKLYSKHRSSIIDINYSAKSVCKSKEYIFFSDNLSIPSDIFTIYEATLGITP